MPPSDAIRTFTGRWVRPLDADPTTLDIRDIAHGLSLLCRFNGHSQRFYSVAEHSVRVSQALPPDHALAGLLHDAAEAYLGDLPRPFKGLIPLFQDAEDRLLDMIFARFGLPPGLSPEVRRADDLLLSTELRDLMGGTPGPLPPLDERIEPWTASQAEAAFLARFEEHSGELGPSRRSAAEWRLVSPQSGRFRRKEPGEPRD